MKKLLVLTFALALVAFTGSASAQLKGLMGKMTGQPAPASTAAPTTAPTGDALVSSYVNSLGLVLTAQGSIADALGMKHELELLQSERKAIGGGSLDLDAMKKATQLSESAQKAIDVRVASQPEMSTEARSKFANALLEYVRAAAGGARLILDAKGYLATAGSNPLALVGKARSGLWVAKQTPGYVKALGTTTRGLIDYGKRAGIKTPAEATKALDGL